MTWQPDVPFNAIPFSSLVSFYQLAVPVLGVLNIE
ncbi:hypothetical protein BDD30_4347 [Photorhabdus asymbiotica]|uniref:Uncharacterized protein n=1 Tax=Photorhabdus asymbiotica TaxID=291112 RepID=A0ABX9SHD6_9GAMM|nr:hypothetical protein BDD30_4347 [Photorhabdus asymbiotica]